MLKRGFTLIAAIFVVLAMALLAVTTSTFISTDALISIRNFRSQQAFYIASAGVEYYLKELSADDNWSSPPTVANKPFAGGVFSLTTTGEARDQITFVATGQIVAGATTYQRAIRVALHRGQGETSDIFLEYLVYGGSGGVNTTVGNDSDITGSIFVNSNLVVGRNVSLSGDAKATGSIVLGAGTTVSGTVESNVAAPESFPEIDTTYYDNLIAQAALVAPGNWDRGSMPLSSGNSPYLVNGSITIQNEAVVTVSGEVTVVATGNISIGNNVILGDNLSLIAGGTINAANNTQIGKAGTWYSRGLLTIGNNFTIGGSGEGEGVAFLSSGDILLGNLDINEGKFNGLIFCEGSFIQTGNNFRFEGGIITGFMGQIGNNATLLTNPDIVDFVDVPGLVSTSEADLIIITSWSEVY